MALVCTTCLKEAPDAARSCPNPQCGSEVWQPVPSLVARVLDGRYKVERLLGVGAMGEIWQASHVHTGQPRAIKILSPAASDEGATDRVLNELRATALADNAHTATVYEAGTLGDGRVYLALELVAGRTLEEDLLSRRGSGRESSWRRVAHIAAQVCAGLDSAHRVGVVHRDLKPANVMLAPRDGDPLFTKVLDFGIATITAGTSTSGAVKPGLVAGTPEYMSPEQLHGGKPVDHRTDLYSLGVLIYEMLAGAPPLIGPTPLDIARARHKKVAPSVRHVRPDVPPALDQLIQDLLAKEPFDRPPSAAAVRERLRSLLGQPRTGQSQVTLGATTVERPLSRLAIGRGLNWRRVATVGLVAAISVGVLWGILRLATLEDAQPPALKTPSSERATPAAPASPSPPVAPAVTAGPGEAAVGSAPR